MRTLRRRLAEWLARDTPEGEMIVPRWKGVLYEWLIWGRRPMAPCPICGFRSGCKQLPHLRLSYCSIIDRHYETWWNQDGTQTIVYHDVETVTS